MSKEKVSLAGHGDSVTKELADSFAKVLGRHGYGFQFSVLRKAHEMADAQRSAWRFVASEFPVEVQGASTRVDFIMRRRKAFSGFDSSLIFLLAECKRANPKLSNWCFVRSRYTHDQAWGDTEPLIVECLEHEEAGGVRAYAKQKFLGAQKTYHIGVEVRSVGTGDPGGETGRAIEDAATQASRHLNGYIKAAATYPQLLEGQSSAFFLPVIFTTARLYVSKADISLADLITGKSELTTDQVEAVPWLYYQYSQSPGLKHPVERKEQPKRASDLLQSEYIRTIAVVSAGGIEDFLYTTSFIEFRD
jgi:hypothetical protein